MRRLAWLLPLVSLAACNLSSEDCEDTPGRVLTSPDITDILTGAVRLAVGGKQRYVGVDRECDGDTMLELRVATVANPALATASIFNGVAVLTGVADGTTTLATQDTDYSEETEISVATIAHVANLRVSRKIPYAVIELRDGEGDPVVDDSLTVSGPLALGDRWDRLVTDSAAPGDYAETIHAGGADWPITVTVTP